MIVNEAQRAQYLNAMGLSVFVPRVRLIGAKVSVQAKLPVAQSSSASKAVSQPAAARVLMDEVLAKPAVEKPVDAAPAPSVHPKPSEHVPLVEPFSLSLWRPNAHWLILDQRDAAAALPTHQLLQNILRAMGCDERLAEPQVLQWPVAGLTEEAAPLQDAQAMLQGVLQGRLATQAATHLWVMGEILQKVVLSAALHEKLQKDRVAQVLALDDFNALGLVLPSLTNILRKPSLKADVWSVLSSYKLA